MMKRILLSLLILSATGALAFGVSRAFFSDTETSTGNTFTAGAIDLKVDNTSYYNGESADGKLALWPTATWTETDLTGQLFFNFIDVKPGDLGEDTVSLKVLNNPAWVCADIDITANDDITCTEPELVDDASCDPNVTKNGELADQLNFIFWADDGDNVLEVGEEPLAQGSAKDVLGGVTWALADSKTNIWTKTANTPMEPNLPKYIGKAWCFGVLTPAPLPDQFPPEQADNNPVIRGAGVTCNGKDVNNAAQTDKLMGDIVFRAVQARHNEQFVCERPVKPTRVLSSLLNYSSTGWGGWSCPMGTTAIAGGWLPPEAVVGPHGVYKQGVTIGTYTWPAFAGYTYSAGESGFILQNGGTGQTLQLWVDCLAD